MTLDEIKKLVTYGESDTLEFKESTATLKAAIQTLCAYLNADGGKVLIGIKNNGSIVGQLCADNTQQEIARCLIKIEPPIRIKIEYVSVQDQKQVIVMVAPKSEHKPHVYEGRPYWRNGSSTSVMPQHHYEQLLVERGQQNHSWEETIVNDCTIEDLDQDEIYKTVVEGIKIDRIPGSAVHESAEDILSRFKLITNGKLKRAALVLFAKNDFSYDYGMIKLARFKGVDKLGNFIDNQQIYGNVFKLLNDTNAFLSRHLPIASFFNKDQFLRIDKSILPVAAVREALINSMTHRDYTNSGAAIMLAIYDDRIDLWNYGSLPNAISLEDLKGSHPSLPRNKLIAKVFYARGMIETWGTGTNKMINMCREDGVPAPIFEQYGGGLSVTFKFKEPIGSQPVFHSIKVNYDDLSDQQKLIMQLLRKHGKLSPKELMTLIDYKISDKTLRKELNKLKDLRLIYSEGETKSRRWGSLM